MAEPTIEAPINVAGITLVSHDYAAQFLGMKGPSLSTCLSRGDLPLTRYYRGRSPWYDLAEVEQVILKSAVPAGSRKRCR